ncbi:hypothetical protein SAMN06298212_10112 [Ruaniaceae bacterium KH17]|nr:hypothetical protein SAMN06298212_10112 [Ruaniaceae bacterium KH17]
MTRDDDGQITILSIGLAVVAIALVFVVVSVSAIYLDRKALQAAADAIAADAASRLSDTYYLNPDGVVRLTDQGVTEAAGEYLALYGAEIGVPGARVASPTGAPDGRTAVVTLTMPADVILIPALLDLPSAVNLTVTSRARAGNWSPRG